MDSLRRNLVVLFSLVVVAVSALLLAGCPDQSKTKLQIERAKTDAVTAEKASGTNGRSTSILPPIGAATASSGLTNVVEVFGDGEITVVPDLAIINAEVSTQAKTAKAAKDQNSKDMNNVIAAVKKFGVAEKDIKTTNFNVFPEYSYDNNVQKLIGYRVSNSVEIKNRKLDKTGELLDVLVDAGSNVVNGVSMTVEDVAAIQGDALNAAVKNATAKAQKVAKDNGLKISGIAKIVEIDSGSPIIHGGYEAGIAAGVDMAKTITPVSPGETKVTSRVQVSFGID